MKRKLGNSTQIELGSNLVRACLLTMLKSQDIRMDNMLRYHRSSWINLVKWRGNESIRVGQSSTTQENWQPWPGGLWASCPAEGINPQAKQRLKRCSILPVQLLTVLPPKSSWVDSSEGSAPAHGKWIPSLNQLDVGKSCASSRLHSFPLAASSWYSGQRPFHRSFGKWDVEESWRFNS